MTGRPLVALIGLATLVAGCGASEIKAGRDPAACARGAPEVGVKDVLPAPPPGMKIIRSDPKIAGPIKKSLSDESGNTVRSIHSRVVAKQGRVYGVGVFVANLNERMDPRAIDVGAKVAEEEAGIESQERITIAGEDALLVRANGGVLATGVAGDCSAVTLIGDEAEVRVVAEKIQRAD